MCDIESIIGSWSELATRIEQTGRLGTWRRRKPALAGITAVDQLRQATAAPAGPARADAVCHALVALAAADGGDDPEALLVLTHLQAGWIVRLAGEFANLANDALAVVTSELACRIRTYPHRRRPRAVAANLKWDTRKALARRLYRGPACGRGHGRSPWPRTGWPLAATSTRPTRAGTTARP
jgi:hypothetical protein